MICLEERGKKKLRCEGTLLDTVSKRIQKSGKCIICKWMRETEDSYRKAAA